MKMKQLFGTLDHDSINVDDYQLEFPILMNGGDEDSIAPKISSTSLSFDEEWKEKIELWYTMMLTSSLVNTRQEEI